jgi:hypothetical protein
MTPDQPAGGAADRRAGARWIVIRSCRGMSRLALAGWDRAAEHRADGRVDDPFVGVLDLGGLGAELRGGDDGDRCMSAGP